MDKRSLHQLKRLCFVLLLIMAIYFFSKYIMILFYPFILAIILAYLMNPLVTYIENNGRMPRIIATICVVSFIATLTAGLIIFIFKEVIESATDLAEKVPSYFQSFIITIENFIQFKITPLYNKVIMFIQNFNGSEKATINDYIHQLASQITDYGTTLLRTLLLKIPLLLSYLPQSIITFIFILIATVLITNDWPYLKRMFLKTIPLSISNSSQKVISNFKKSLFRYFKAQMILIFIAMFIIFITLLILNIEHALTISLLIAFIDVLPLIGTGLVFVPWIVYLFLTTEYSLMISIALLYMFIVLTRQILEPKIVSAQIGIKPLAALLLLFISIKLWGAFPGILVTPFLLVLVSSFYQAGMHSQLLKYIKG